MTLPMFAAIQKEPVKSYYTTSEILAMANSDFNKFFDLNISGEKILSNSKNRYYYYPVKTLVKKNGLFYLKSVTYVGVVSQKSIADCKKTRTNLFCELAATAKARAQASVHRNYNYTRLIALKQAVANQ